MDSNKNYTNGNSNYVQGNYQYGNGAYGAYGQGNYGYGNGNYGAYGAGNYGGSAYGGSNAYGQANNQYGGPNNYGNNNYNGQYAQQGGFDPNQEEGFNFNIMEWVFRILKYWYLFVISLVIAMGAATLKNRKWLQSYRSTGTIIIKETGGYGYSGGTTGALMQGFGLDAGYKNTQNQLYILKSFDLMCRVVDSLPFMMTEYYSMGRFKTRNLYHNTPIIVQRETVDPGSFGPMFKVDFQSDGSMIIGKADEDDPFRVHANYGERIECPFFTITILPSSPEKMQTSGSVYFKFRTRDGLAQEFMVSLQTGFQAEGSTILGISLTSETPERDVEFIDKLAEVFLQQNLEQKNEVAENSIKFINQQLETLQASLEVSEGAMTDFRQENKFVDVGSYAGQLMGRISEYDQKTMELRLRETYFDYITNYIKTNMESGAVIAPTSLGLNEPLLFSLVQQLNQLRVQRGELTEKNVYYAKYSKDIENVKTTIAEVVNSMRASLEIEKEDLNTRYADVEKELKKLPRKELQMVAIERNYRIDDNYYTFFLQKRAEAEIQKASNMPDNTILDKARTLYVVNSGDRKKTTSTYLILGLLIPLALIIISELLNNKVRNPKDVEKISPVFRMIGILRHAKSQNPTLVKTHPRSSYAELLRAIRTRIEFVVKRKTKMLITVSSTESGDGKTFVCTNMASLYAAGGNKTLLIDLDIRKPNIHAKLGLESGMGITNYIIGDCELEDIFIQDSPFDFDIVRAGTIPPNPGELIHSEKLAEFIAQMRDKYDFVIIDTSPIGLVPDAYPVIELSDMSLFVIRCMQTNKSFAKQTLEQISEVVDNPEKIRIILSDVPNEGVHGYGYGYGYGYGGYGKYGYGGGKKGYGYGYGYGQKRTGIRYRYSKYYHRLLHKEDKNAYNYYSDDDV